MMISVRGHGRLMDPPARNAMWRFGYPNPVNYNDNELFCGGFAVQWEKNKGRCGVCGDAYHVKKPRPHEAGGQYAKGIISRYYTSGQEIDVEVELTANHYGRFEMFLCPNNNPRQEASQACFDRYPLLISGSREHRYLIPRDAKKKDIFRYRVRLPPYVTCTQCVLQWTYYTANMWGTCANGTEAVGCGKAGEHLTLSYRIYITFLLRKLVERPKKSRLYRILIKEIFSNIFFFTINANSRNLPELCRYSHRLEHRRRCPAKFRQQH